MKIEHMVWARFKEGTARSEIAGFLAQVEAMGGRVPGLLEVKAGPNVTELSGGYTHGWTMTFASREALEAYGEHPDHLALAEPLLRRAASLVKMDIAFGDTEPAP